MLALLAFASILLAGVEAKQLTLQVRQQFKSPDCVERMVVTVNGQFPAPEIRVQPGELVEVTVENHLLSHALSVHWHGMSMADTPWQDGSSMLSSCSIGPGTSWVYRFRANSLPGTYMYHAHVGFLRLMGLSGALIIEGDVSEHAKNATEEFTVLLQDWYHMPADMMATGMIEAARLPSLPQSILVNGQGEFNCFNNQVYTCENETTCTVGAPASQKPWFFEGASGYPQAPCNMDTCPGLTEFAVEKGQTYLFRLVHIGAEYSFNLALEGHNMTIIEADGMPVTPTEVPSVDIHTGNRFGVLVTMNAAPGKSAIRVVLRHFPGPETDGFAVLSYGDAPPGATIDPTVAAAMQPNAFLEWGHHLEQQNSLLAHPSTASDLQVPSDDEVEQRFEFLSTLEMIPSGERYHAGMPPNFRNITEAIGEGGETPESFCAPVDGGSLRMMLGRQTFSLPSTPVLSKLFFKLGVEELTEQNGYIQVKVGGVYDVVIQNYHICPGLCLTHGWHLHGGQFWSLGSGEGLWTGSEQQWDSLNTDNPPMLDVVSTVGSAPLFVTQGQPGGCGWTFFRFRVDHPGVFFLHCHQMYHQTIGAGVVFHTGSEGLPQPPENLLLCGDMTVKNVYEATVPAGEEHGEEHDSEYDAAPGTPGLLGQPLMGLFFLALLCTTGSATV